MLKTAEFITHLAKSGNVSTVYEKAKMSRQTVYIEAQAFAALEVSHL